jgi:hypothetical protein
METNTGTKFVLILFMKLGEDDIADASSEYNNYVVEGVVPNLAL